VRLIVVRLQVAAIEKAQRNVEHQRAAGIEDLNARPVGPARLAVVDEGEHDDRPVDAVQLASSNSDERVERCAGGNGIECRIIDAGRPTCLNVS